MLGYRESNDKPPVHLKGTKCFLGKCAICDVILLSSGRWCCDISRSWEPAFSTSRGCEQTASPLCFHSSLFLNLFYYEIKFFSSCSAPNFNCLSRSASSGFASLDYHRAGRKNTTPNPNLSTGIKSVRGSIPHNVRFSYV